MTEKPNHINYSAADIEKYWKGQLSPQEMHALEKAALEDPFLADALEGYEARTAAPDLITNDIHTLQQRLAERVADKKVIPLAKSGWWKFAAAFVVLAAGVWFYSTINKKDKENKETSVVKNDIVTTPAAPKRDSMDQLSKTNDTLKDLVAAERRRPGATGASKKIPAPVATETAGEKETGKNAVVAANDDALVKQDEAKKAEEKTEPRVTDISIAKRAGKPAADKSAQPELSGNIKGISSENDGKAAANGRRVVAINDPNTFNGKIVDQLNQPVPNASIQIPNLNVATQTDGKGNFSFKARDTALSVSVASVGFETQHVKLQKTDAFSYSNQITLKPATTGLNEVVVTGDGSKKKAFRTKTKDVTIHILDAEPTVDWAAYEDYLAKNKKTPEELKDTHGDVIVSFIVTANNQLTGFSIVKSLDEELDEKAIRLIKEGPAWKILKGKKARVSVTVKF